MQEIITRHREQIAELCRRHHVRRLAVFGSAARDDFDPTRSDVDFLVEFDVPEGVRYATNFFSLQRELSQLFVRNVDLIIASTVRNAIIRRTILQDQELLYAA